MKEQTFAIGIDVGATKTLAGIISSRGNILHKKRIPTDTSKDQIISNLTLLIQELQSSTPGPIKSIGIGIPGWVDEKSNLILHAPNLGWKNLNIKEKIEKKIKLPVFVINDVRAATWAEWKFGAGLDHQNIVYLILGTGIGGGIISNGQLLTGISNTAGELGHIPVELTGLPCTCGGYGCMETLAGGWGIAKKAIIELQNPHFFNSKLHLKHTNITAKDVIESFFEGDPLAKKIIDEAILALITGTTAIVNTLNPEALVLSGGIIEGLPDLISQIKEGLFKRAISTAIKSLKVLPGYFKNDSGMVGSALYSLHFS